MQIDRIKYTMNARETLDKLYPELKDKVLPVIEELGL